MIISPICKAILLVSRLIYEIKSNSHKDKFNVRFFSDGNDRLPNLSWLLNLHSLHFLLVTEMLAIDISQKCDGLLRPVLKIAFKFCNKNPLL